MRRVWAIARKEILQTGRDRLAFLFMIVMPVVFTVFLGLLLGGVDDSPQRLPLAIVDEDEGTGSKALAELLGSSAIVEIVDVDASKIESAVQDSEIAGALIIPQGFSTALEAGGSPALTLVRADGTVAAQPLEEAVSTAAAELVMERRAASIALAEFSQQTGQSPTGAMKDSALQTARLSLQSPAVAVATVEAGLAAGQTARGFDQSTPGTMVNFMLFSLMGVAIVLVLERKQGILRRLMTTGTMVPQIIGGKMLGMVILVLTQQLFLMLLGQLAFGVDFFRDPAALAVVLVSTAVMGSSLGLLISTAFRSEQAVIATIVIGSMVLAAMGGAWFPLEVTSPAFSTAGHFLPTAWIIDSFHGIILRGWGLTDILVPMAIVWGYAALFLGVAVWRFRAD